MCRTLMTKNTVVGYELVYSKEKKSYGISAHLGQNPDGSSNTTCVFLNNLATDLATAQNLLDKIAGMCVLPSELPYIIQDLA